MYTPRSFALDNLAEQHALITAHPLGALVTQADGGLDADHIPFLLTPPSAEAPWGTLRGHVARANPVWQRGGPALAIFRAAEAYISPSWYEGKASHHKEVPTYDYAVVHAHGTLRAIDDPGWLRTLLTDLTARHEQGRSAPWAMEQAPADYIATLLKAIVGIELQITRLDGKVKASQNRNAADRSRVRAALADEAPAMAPWIP